MELKHLLKLPRPYGKIVEDYLKVIDLDKQYTAYTINDKLEVVKCVGIIKNNGLYSYHKNEDISENEMYVIGDGVYGKWFTLNENEAIKIQKENIKIWKDVLNDELNRIESL